jgi:hypothetical protein
MSAIKSDFASLPPDGDPTQAAAFAAVLTELRGRKWPLPAGDAKTLKRADMVAHLQGIAGAIIAAELKEDAKRPAKPDRTNPIPRLYAYQAEAEESKPPPPVVPLSDEGIAGVFNEFRAGRLFVGLPHAPNAITAEDVAAAKKG